MHDFYEISNINGYSTQTFSDIYPDVNTFKTGKTDEYGNKLILGMSDFSELYVPLSASEVTTLYYLLCARYGNSPIANMDQNQFSLKLFSIIYQYGPTWSEKLKLQQALRELSIEDIQKGSKAIYNHALNPSTTPTTASLEELEYINDQNTSSYIKSKPEAISIKWELLKNDVTEYFLKKFQHLFLQIARPTRNIYYGTEE